MIFVTVGTTHGFDRLIQAVDKAVDKGLIEDEVYAQIGKGTYAPRNFEYVCALKKEEFEACMKQASGVISHAGIGALISASDHGKRILVMPRRKRYREVVNDHQVAIAEEFARLGHVLHARNEEELLEKVGRLATFVPVPRKVNKDAVIGRIAGFLSSVRPPRRRRDRDRWPRIAERDGRRRPREESPMVHNSKSDANRSTCVEDSRTSEVDADSTPAERGRHIASNGGEDWAVCNVCGADDYTIVFRAGEAQVHQVVRCNQCSLMYANPRTLLPNFEGLKILDADPYSLLTRDRFRLPKEVGQVRDYRNTRAFLRAEFPDRGKLVEAGSGTGSLLRFFRDDGWDVEGVDPWAPACFYAKSEYGITTHTKTFEEVGFPDVSIEVLMMRHVIEHMLDPAATFAEAYRTLKPGGILVMETPRYDSLLFKVLGKRERSVSCGGHIYFFTTDSLTRLGKKAGFSVREVMYVGRTLSLDRLAFQIGVMSKSEAVQRLVNYVPSRLKLDRVRIYLNFRDMQRVYFAKPR